MPRSIRRPHAPAWPASVTELLGDLPDMRGQVLTVDSIITQPLGSTPEDRETQLRFLVKHGFLGMKAVFADDATTMSGKRFVRYEWTVK